MAILHSGNFQIEIGFHDFKYGNIYFYFVPYITRTPLFNHTKINAIIPHGVIVNNEGYEYEYLVPFFTNLLEQQEKSCWTDLFYNVTIKATTWKTERRDMEARCNAENKTVLVSDVEGELKTTPYMEGVGDILDLLNDNTLQISFTFYEAAFSKKSNGWLSGEITLGFKITLQQLQNFTTQLKKEFEEFAAIHAHKPYWLGKNMY